MKKEQSNKGTFNLDDRPMDERIKEFEEKNGKLKTLTKEELKEYGLAD